MILLISTNKEKLHDLEFVTPIENIFKKNNVNYKTINYSKLSKVFLEKANKIIICGTSLQDNEFLKHLDKFTWIKTINKPVLGICAGAQIISLIYGAKIKTKTEIGFYKENFSKEFLGLKGEQEVYHLHNNYTTLPKDFVKYTQSKISQAIRHKTKNIFGVLFHPEVRNSELIKNFSSQ